jgi:hypothetical protein
MPAEQLAVGLGLDRFVPNDRRPLLTRLADMAEATIVRWKAANATPVPGLYYLALTVEGALEVRWKAPREGLRYGEVLVALIR